MNGGPLGHFYVEPRPGSIIGDFPYETQSPSVHRLRGRTGHFNIEIPINSPQLKIGWNEINILIEDKDGKVFSQSVEFSWNPDPIPLPIELIDISNHDNIQSIGQIVNGNFNIDRKRNVICSEKPVGSDSLLLIGSPYGSQEATYDVKFSNPGVDWCFVGISDFFVGHLEQSPDLGIKPGYSTAGLATIDHKGRSQIWLAWGDCLIGKKNTWVVKTNNPTRVNIKSDITYSVRHQAVMQDGVNFSRFRIWQKNDQEPVDWLCFENNLNRNSRLPSITKSSFGLFQYWGKPTEWSNIIVRPLDIDIKNIKLKKRGNQHFRRLLTKAKKIGSGFLDN